MFKSMIFKFLVLGCVTSIMAMNPHGKHGMMKMMMKGHPICGKTDECIKNTMRCHKLIMMAMMGEKGEDNCPEGPKKMEQFVENCITETGMDELYEEHYNEIGRFMPSAAIGFMDKIMITDKDASHKLHCCVIKAKGMANDAGFFSVDKMAEKLLMSNDDEELVKGVEKGRELCSVADSCDPMRAKRCFMEECIRVLSM